MIQTPKEYDLVQISRPNSNKHQALSSTQNIWIENIVVISLQLLLTLNEQQTV